jgi:hypothetical protein
MPELRYRIVCYELDGENQTVILDTTARAFTAVTGTLDENGTMHGTAPTPARSRCSSASPA